MSTEPKGLGWIPDLPDIRDFKFSARGVIKHDDLPTLVNLKEQCPPVYDQGPIGSCTAQAIIANYEFLLRRQYASDLEPLSRLFLYYCERERENTVEIDAGATLRTGMKVIADIGVCKDSSWLYITADFNARPNSECFEQATIHQALRYEKVSQDLTSLKECLAAGFPFVFGFAVYENFYQGDGIFMDFPKGRLMGGHAVMAVGYDDTLQRFTIRNSWGESWGDGGYFYMPYSILTDPNISRDLWALKLVEG